MASTQEYSACRGQIDWVVERPNGIKEAIRPVPGEWVLQMKASESGQSFDLDVQPLAILHEAEITVREVVEMSTVTNTVKDRPMQLRLKKQEDLHARHVKDYR